MTQAQAAHWALTVGRMFKDTPTNGEYGRLKKDVLKSAHLLKIGKKRVYVFPTVPPLVKTYPPCIVSTRLGECDYLTNLDLGSLGQPSGRMSLPGSLGTEHRL